MNKQQRNELMDRLERPVTDTITFNVNAELKREVFDILSEDGVTMTLFLIVSMENLVKRDKAIKENKTKKKKGSD